MSLVRYVLLCLLISGSVYAECTYQFDPKDVRLTWTAFKLAEKAGVNGTFKKLGIKGKLVGNSMSEVLKQVKFSINHQSINTKNKARDVKIARSFFSTMQGKYISGSFKVLNGKNSGETELKVTMNGVKSYVPMSYSIFDGDTLKLEGVMNILAFSATKQLAALNEACRAKHKSGYTWADVKLLLEAKFKKVCR